MGKKTIVLINHQPIMLNGLVKIFRDSDFFLLVDKTNFGAQEVGQGKRAEPDIILIDALNSEKLITIISQATQKFQKTKIIAFTSMLDVEVVVRALDAGASGYVTADVNAIELLSAIKMVAEGHTFISPNLATKVIGALRVAARRKALNTERKLNVREEQIVELLLKGKTNKEIANALGLQEKTVKHYMTLLMHKLDARNRLELAMTLRLPENVSVDSRLFN